MAGRRRDDGCGTRPERLIRIRVLRGPGRAPRLQGARIGPATPVVAALHRRARLRRLPPQARSARITAPERSDRRERRRAGERARLLRDLRGARQGRARANGARAFDRRHRAARNGR